MTTMLCIVAVLHRGVVIVDVPLFWLDINQCPQDYFVPNAFKDTARCHYDTTYVCTKQCLIYDSMLAKSSLQLLTANTVPLHYELP